MMEQATGTKAESKKDTKSKAVEVVKHESLREALCHAMLEYEPLEKNMGVDFTTKQGFRVKYNYADLAATRRMTDPCLLKHGLVVTDRIVRREEKEFLVTIMEHAHSEDVIETELEVTVAGNDMKDLGANITYARRYNYWMLTGRVGEDDSEPRDIERNQPEKSSKKASTGQSKAETSEQSDKTDKSKSRQTKDSMGTAHGRADTYGISDADWKDECLRFFATQGKQYKSRTEVPAEEWTEYLKFIDESRITGYQEEYITRYVRALGYESVENPDFMAFVKAKIGKDIAKSGLDGLSRQQANNLLTVLGVVTKSKKLQVEKPEISDDIEAKTDEPSSEGLFDE